MRNLTKWLQPAPAPKEPKSSLKKSPAAENAPEGWWPGGPKNCNFVGQTKTFFREVRMELKKVTWPTRKETLAATAMVIILIGGSGLFFGDPGCGLSQIGGFHHGPLIGPRSAKRRRRDIALPRKG